MKTVAVMPSSCAASATPCAWLPALAATTPRSRSAADSRAIRVYAPRILNEPVRCRFSHLRWTGPPAFSASTRLCSSGVTRVMPSSSLRAPRTSSRSTVRTRRHGTQGRPLRVGGAGPQSETRTVGRPAHRPYGRSMNAVAARPPGPDLGLLEIARLVRSRRLTEFVERAAERGPTVSRFRVGGDHLYLVGTPELVRELFGPLGRVTAKGRGLEQSRRLLGQGLLTSEGDLHRQQRRLIQPAFHSGRVQAYAASMRQEAAALPERAGWADGAVRDVAADMAALTLRIVGRTLFAADLAGDSDRVYAALSELLTRFQRVMVPGGVLLNRLPLPSTRRLTAAIAELDGVVMRMVAQHRSRGGDDDSVLGWLLAARDSGGQPMPDRQVRDEVLTLMLAGHETTANALSWSWLLLDRNPAAADRLHAELALAGWTVPAGSLVAASQWVLHRDARWWPEPLEFRPERWIGPDGFDESAPGQPRGAYFPFGMGRRVCIGESFAWTEAVLVLAALARDWAPALVPGHPVAVRSAVTLRPAGGMPMILTRHSRHQG